MLRRCCSLLLLLTAGGLTAAEKPKSGIRRIELQWRDLDPIVIGRHVKLALPDGTRLQGKVLGVEPQALVLEVGRTSNRQAWPKGEGAIPRELVTEFQLTKTTGYTWRVIGTVLGAAAGAALGGAIAMAEPGAGIAVFAGLAGAGFWGGWASDREVRLVKVVPNL